MNTTKAKVLVGIDKSKSFRVCLVITTDIVEEARKLHACTPVATALLGRMLTATALMTQDLKAEENRLTLIMQGDGPAMEVVTSAKGDGSFKGYISNPSVDLPLRKDGKLDVGGAIGIGELRVIKDLGLKEPYSGAIALVSGEVAEDLTAYYYISEQQNTSISLGVKVGKDMSVLASSGLFVQLLPNAAEEAIEELEKVIGARRPISTLTEEVHLRSKGLRDEEELELLLGELFEGIASEFDLETLEFKEVSYGCDCSRDRMKIALATIGEEELTKIIDEDAEAELSCSFCRASYVFPKEELEDMRDKARRGEKI